MRMAATIDQTRPDQTRPDQPIVRNSSLELLRIVAMFMIVTFHFFYQAGFDISAIPPTLSGLWLAFWGVGMSTGNVGNNLFLLITGYFLINSRSVKVGHLFNLWLRVAFYSVTIFVLFTISGRIQFTLKGMAFAFMPLLTRQSWFCSYYFLLYIIHPYLNDVLHDLSRDNYRKFIAFFLAVLSLLLITSKKVGFCNIPEFMLLYVIGGYIRLWADDVKGKRYILYGLVFMAVNFMVFHALGFNSFTADGKGVYPGYYLQSKAGLFNILAAVCIFISFKSINMPYIRIINLIASATLGVYVIHDNGLVRKFLLYEVFRNASFQYSPYLIPYSIAVTLHRIHFLHCD